MNTNQKSAKKSGGKRPGLTGTRKQQDLKKTIVKIVRRPKPKPKSR